MPAVADRSYIFVVLLVDTIMERALREEERRAYPTPMLLALRAVSDGGRQAIDEYGPGYDDDVQRALNFMQAMLVERAARKWLFIVFWGCLLAVLDLTRTLDCRSDPMSHVQNVKLT